MLGWGSERIVKVCFSVILVVGGNTDCRVIWGGSDREMVVADVDA